MRVLTLVLFAVFFSQFVIAQGHCIKVKQLNNTEIRALFPLNFTEHIKLVSFKASFKDSISNENDVWTSPKKNGLLDRDKFLEEKTLNPNLEKELLDKLINYGKDPADSTGTVVFGYEPQHAILFVDKADIIVGYIEISFDCLQAYSFPEGSLTIDFPEEKFKIIKDLFRKAGIKYGVNK